MDEDNNEGGDITPVEESAPSRQSSQQKKQQSQPQTPQMAENNTGDEGAILTPTNKLQEHNYEQYLDQAVANAHHLPKLENVASKNNSQLQKEAHLKMPLISQPQASQFSNKRSADVFSDPQGQQLNDTARYSNRHFQFQNSNNQLHQQSPRGGVFSNPRLAQQPKNPNFHSNDSAVLQQRLSELESEMMGLDMEYERMTLENEELKEQHEEIKFKNKQLFEQLTQQQQLQQTATGEFGDINEPESLYGGNPQQDDTNNNIGEIHSLYQDLFLTDIKREVENAQTELKQCKQEQNNAQREMTYLKKENMQLQATLKRYRKQLQEMTANPSAQQHAKDLINQLMVTPQQKVQMSLNHDTSSITGKPKGLQRSDSGGSSITNAVTVTQVGNQSANQHQTQATYIEAARIDKLLQAFLALQNVPDERFLELLSLSLRELKHSLLVANCANCTIFIFNPELQKNLQRFDRTQNVQGLAMQKFALEGGKWIDGICEIDKEIGSPAFKTPGDIKSGFKNNQYMIQSVIHMQKDDEIVMAVQCEARFDKKTNKYKGFQVSDEQILKVFCYYLQLRFERRIALREVKLREKTVVDTLKLTSEICTQRHHDGLFKKMKENLPEFFGFEAVGVLIYNFEKFWLFTDPDQLKEGPKKGKNEDSDGDDDGNQKSKKAPIVEELTPEQEAAREKELHHKHFMQFPTNSGISGMVFQSGQIYISNNAAKETKFQDEIDNQSSTTEVRNFLIGPVYGERKDVPCGIIQFINKKNGAAITSEDEKKFRAMQGLLGMCIDNTNEMSLTISVTLDVQDSMHKIQGIMNRDQMQEKEMKESEEKILNLQKHVQSIRETYNKLLDDRAKAKNQI